MYITEDHEGVQILTQWDTGIKSCQKAVLKTAKQYLPFYFLLFLLLRDLYKEILKIPKG
jgi:hypothetical protein